MIFSAQEFLTLVDGFLRMALARSYLSAESLTKILQVTASLYRKAGSPEQCLSANHIALFILVQLTDKLNHKAHVTSSTLVSLLEVSLSTFNGARCSHRFQIFSGNSEKECPIPLTYERYATLADAGFAYLYADGLGTSSLAGFAASQAVANMVLQVAEDQPQVLSKIAVSDLCCVYTRTSL